MTRFLAGRALRLTHTFLDDEDALHPDAVTVTVTRLGGDEPAAAGEATRDGDVYTFSAGLLPEGVYTVRWDGGTVVDEVTAEVVGGYLFTIPEARASDDDLTATRYPAEQVKGYREVVETEFERITGRSFTPRTLYVEASKFGAPGDPFPVTDVRSCSVLGTANSPVQLDTVGPFAFWPELPEGATGVEIAYGFEQVPDDIKRVGILRLKWLLMAERSAIPDRATSYQPADGGTYTLATPGRAGYTTGIPDVDAVLDAYRFKILESVYLP